MSDVNNQYIKIIKTCPGNLSFELVNPTTNARQIVRIAADSQGKILPLSWAALVYSDNSSGAYKLYKGGYFTFDKPDVVKDYAAKNDLIFGDVDMTPIESPTYETDIVSALKLGSVVKLDKFFDTDKHKSDVIRLARANLKDIKAGTIKYLEEKLKIKLQIDGE